MHEGSMVRERHSKRIGPTPVLLVAGILLAVVVSSAAQTSSPASSEPSAPLLLPHEGATLERYIDGLRRDFTELDADADGKITQADVDLHVLMEEVMLHAYAAMSVMRFDLDGDGVVTEDEIRRGSRYYFKSAVNGPQSHTEEEVREVMALDADKDGKVSFSEAGKYRHPEMLRILGMPGVSARARRALALEPGLRRGVALADYTAAGETLFRKIDADHDGTTSRDELAAYRRAR